MVAADIFIAPIVTLLLLGIAYFIRPWVTYEENKQYFFPALVLKYVGAISLGLLYQFYYSGGDTFSYFSNGAAKIYEAFLHDPVIAFKLIFYPNDYSGGVYEYASQIWMYRDSASYMVVRIAGVFTILTGGTYAGTALLFATVSFSGIWAMYMKFCKLFPNYLFPLAVAILFVPSTIFWGSGILKDSITFGMLCWSTAGLITLIYGQRGKIGWTLVMLFALIIAFSIKEYIVLSFIPAAMIWVYFIFMKKISSKMLRILVAPILISVMLSVALYSVYMVGETSERYSLSSIAETARVTAYDVGRWTGRNAGSKYDLGDYDGTLSSMIRLAPSAINVSLFRPYLWEVGNPLMLLASLESLALLIITVIILLRMVRYRLNVLTSPAAWFSLVFSLTFAFGVGISTYNFGTLFRYKVPLMPFYAILLVLTWESSRNYKSSGQTQRSNLSSQL